MNAEGTRGFGITAFCIAEGCREDHLFFGLVEDVVVLRACEFCGLLFEDAGGEVLGEDLFGEAEDDGVFDCVLEFANVAGPTIAREESACVGGDAFEGALGFCAYLEAKKRASRGMSSRCSRSGGTETETTLRR